ncbi:hypothetical protein ACTSKR_14350 [Chitinibacteraceae bacterium HSL-7]
MDQLVQSAGQLFASPWGWGGIVLALIAVFFVTRIIKLVLTIAVFAAIALGLYWMQHPAPQTTEPISIRN